MASSEDATKDLVLPSVHSSRSVSQTSSSPPPPTGSHSDLLGVGLSTYANRPGRIPPSGLPVWSPTPSPSHSFYTSESSPALLTPVSRPQAGSSISPKFLTSSSSHARLPIRTDLSHQGIIAVTPSSPDDAPQPIPPTIPAIPSKALLASLSSAQLKVSAVTIGLKSHANDREKIKPILKNRGKSVRGELDEGVERSKGGNTNEGIPVKEKAPRMLASVWSHASLHHINISSNAPPQESVSTLESNADVTGAHANNTTGPSLTLTSARQRPSLEQKEHVDDHAIPSKKSEVLPLLPPPSLTLNQADGGPILSEHASGGGNQVSHRQGVRDDEHGLSSTDAMAKNDGREIGEGEREGEREGESNGGGDIEGGGSSSDLTMDISELNPLGSETRHLDTHISSQDHMPLTTIGQKSVNMGDTRTLIVRDDNKYSVPPQRPPHAPSSPGYDIHAHTNHNDDQQLLAPHELALLAGQHPSERRIVVLKTLHHSSASSTDNGGSGSIAGLSTSTTIQTSTSTGINVVTSAPSTSTLSSTLSSSSFSSVPLPQSLAEHANRLKISPTVLSTASLIDPSIAFSVNNKKTRLDPDSARLVEAVRYLDLETKKQLQDNRLGEYLEAPSGEGGQRGGGNHGHVGGSDKVRRLVQENERLRMVLLSLRKVEDMNAQLQLELDVLRRNTNSHTNAEFDTVKNRATTLQNRVQQLEEETRDAKRKCDEANAVIDAMRQGKDALQVRVAIQHSDLTALRQQCLSYSQEINEKNEKNNGLMVENTKLQTETHSLQRQLHSLNGRVTSLSSDLSRLSKQEDDLRRQLRVEQQRYTMMEGDKKEMEKRGMERENELTSVRDSLRKVMEDLEETRKQANLTMQENKSLKNRVALAEEESMQMRTVVALAKQEKDDIESQTAELIKDLTTRLKASKEDRGLWEERAKKAVNDAERMERKAMEAEASRKLSEKTAKEEAAETVRRNAELEQRTKALEEELSTTSTHLVMMTDRVNRLTQEMNLLEKDLEDAEAQLDLKSAEVGSLVKQVAGHEKELSVVNQLLQEKGMQLESSIAKNVQDETQMANLKQDLTAIRVANAKANDLARDSLAVAKAARAEAETARAQLEHLEKTMGEEVTNLKMELNTAKEARDSAQTRADASEKQAYELNALLESAQAQVTELTSKVTELEGFVAAEAERREADREKVEAASAAVRKAREMRVQLDHAAAMYKDVTDKLTATSKERDDAVSIARTSESALLLSKQELEVALTQSDELRTKLTDKESTLEETKKQLEATSNELTETKAKLNKLELAHRPCDPTIAYLGNQVRELEAKLANPSGGKEAEMHLQRLMLAQKQLDTAKDAAQQAADTVTVLRAASEKLRSDLLEKEEENAKLQLEVGRLRRELATKEPSAVVPTIDVDSIVVIGAKGSGHKDKDKDKDKDREKDKDKERKNKSKRSPTASTSSTSSSSSSADVASSSHDSSVKHKKPLRYGSADTNSTATITSAPLENMDMDSGSGSNGSSSSSNSSSSNNSVSSSNVDGPSDTGNDGEIQELLRKAKADAMNYRVQAEEAQAVLEIQRLETARLKESLSKQESMRNDLETKMNDIKAMNKIMEEKLRVFEVVGASADMMELRQQLHDALMQVKEVETMKIENVRKATELTLALKKVEDLEMKLNATPSVDEETVRRAETMERERNEANEKVEELERKLVSVGEEVEQMKRDMGDMMRQVRESKANEEAMVEEVVHLKQLLVAVNL